MRRTLIGLTVVLAVLLVATPGLVAARGPGGGGHVDTSFMVKGYIAKDGLDPDAGTIVIDVQLPSSYSDPVTVQTMVETEFRDCSGEKIEFGDLAVGDIVKVEGYVDGEIYFATLVIVQYILPE